MPAASTSLAASDSGWKVPAGPDDRAQAGADIGDRSRRATDRGDVIQPQHAQNDGERQERRHEQEKEAHHRHQDAFRHRAAIEGRHDDGVGVDKLVDMLARSGVKDLQAEDLEAASGRSGTAADKQHPEEQHDRQRPPGAVVAGGKAGRGDDRGGIECRQPQGGQNRHAVIQRQPGGQHHPHNGHEGQKGAHLTVAPKRHALALHPADIEHEWQGTEDHEQDQDGLDHRAVKGADRRVVS